jgi:hypothetical protein
MDGMSHNGRKNADEVLLLALACGSSVEKAAEKAGLCPRTVHRRLKTSDFQRRLKELKTDMVNRAVGMLTAASMESVKTLLALQESKVPPAVRLGAARSVLELGTRLRESVELHERIDELEKRVADTDNKNAR